MLTKNKYLFKLIQHTPYANQTLVRSMDPVGSCHCVSLLAPSNLHKSLHTAAAASTKLSNSCVSEYPTTSPQYRSENGLHLHHHDYDHDELDMVVSTGSAYMTKLMAPYPSPEFVCSCAR